MKEAFIRAELFVKALQSIPTSCRAGDVKAYASALEKELKIIKLQKKDLVPKPKEPQTFGPQKKKN